MKTALANLSRGHIVVAAAIAVACIGCDVGLALSGHANSTVLAVVNGSGAMLLGQLLNLGTSQSTAGAAQRAAAAVEDVAHQVFNGGLTAAVDAALNTPTDLAGRVRLVDEEALDTAVRRSLNNIQEAAVKEAQKNAAS
ncbi:MAG TPA: hypothetical protein VFC09_09790 [Candidatus Dormibacteraeota bacterium]|nr:hypothetical protein [Candidatus Dormibacteraeota bacterium]